MKTKLRKYRFDCGDLSQQELADIVKVSRQTIVAIEKGDYNLSVKLALILAKKLNTTVEELFQLEEKDEV
jgi:putative transcriptional regulator